MNPQTPNQTPFFGRKVSKTGINVTQATDNQLILKEDYDQGNTIYYDDSGVANVLIGKRPLTGVRGFYVAKTGIDVRTATDDQLIFNSQNDTLKVVKSGTADVTVMSSDFLTTKTTIIPHNLGFTPASLCYCVGLPGDFTTITGQVLLPYTVFAEGSTASHPYKMNDMAYFCFTTDSTNAYANIVVSDATFYNQLVGTYTFIYYLLQETAA